MNAAQTVAMMTQPQTMLAQRRDALGLLARAKLDELVAPLAQHWGELAVRDLRQPEIGLVMVRGRIGGDGSAFNMGEATVTRAVVELPGGRRGYGQTLGRDREKARFAAIADALWQDETERVAVERAVLAPIRRRLAEERARTASETAATRVDFFTLVRGDPEK
jgi:alpha-D-ribose 1-methylphosphonate 5-triphosphate synthase subunit PhnG